MGKCFYLFITDGVIWYIHYRMQVLENLRNHLWALYAMTPYFTTDTCSSIFIFAPFIIARKWKQHRCQSLCKCTVKCCAFSKQNVIQL